MPKFPCRTALAGVLCLVALPVLADFQTLDGTVAYRARIALPPEAMVAVRLVDISRADAPSITLGAVVPDEGARRLRHRVDRYSLLGHKLIYLCSRNQTDPEHLEVLVRREQRLD